MRPLALFALLSACHREDPHGPGPAAGAPAGTSGGIPTGAPTGTTTPAPTSFALGLEYAQVGLMDAYTPVGLTWAKLRLEAFEWGTSEPAAPAGATHTYDWSCPDAQIADAQRAGFEHLQAWISPKSPWGSVNPLTDVMVRPEHEDALRAWVRALVERYDGDGVDDAPDLSAPVHHWVVGPEWTGFWPSDDHEDYLQFAALVAEEARDTNPDVVLGAIPLYFADTFVGNEPSEAEVASRLANSTLLRNSTEGVLAILDEPQHFDHYSLHALGHTTEVPPTLRWLEAEMDTRGYRLPIWIDDAFPLGLLANQANFPAQYPLTDDQRADAWAALSAIARDDETATPPASEARAWLEREVAKGVVQKGVTALGEGAAGINLGNLEDWMVDANPFTVGLREGAAAVMGAPASFGLRDVTHPDGYDTCDPRTPGAARPGFGALQQLASAIGDGRFDRVVRLGGLEGPRGYRLERDGACTWVLWNEPGAPMALPGDAPPAPVAFDLDVPCPVTSLTAERVVTSRDEVPATETLAVSGGATTVWLDDVPLILR